MATMFSELQQLPSDVLERTVAKLKSEYADDDPTLYTNVQVKKLMERMFRILAHAWKTSRERCVTDEVLT